MTVFRPSLTVSSEVNNSPNLIDFGFMNAKARCDPLVTTAVDAGPSVVPELHAALRVRANDLSS